MSEQVLRYYFKEILDHSICHEYCSTSASRSHTNYPETTLARRFQSGKAAKRCTPWPTTCLVRLAQHIHALQLTQLVPGYETGTANNLRLWSSRAASGEFDFQKFNSGDYESAVADEQRAETISAVLYPNDK